MGKIYDNILELVGNTPARRTGAVCCSRISQTIPVKYLETVLLKATILPEWIPI